MTQKPLFSFSQTLSRYDPRKFGLGPLWGLIFVLLALVNLDRLLDPPYWDALTGVYTQGLWLSTHHFNFIDLAHHGHFMEGGPNIDIFYAFAFLFALLIHWFSPLVTFLVLHLIVVACSALVAALFFVIIRSFTSGTVALLWILSGLFNPVWSGQTASIYLEVPVACAIALSIFFFWKNRYASAATFAFLAYFMKNSAVLYCLACAVYAVVAGAYTAWREKSFPRHPLLWLLVPFPAVALLNHWFLSDATSGAHWDLPGYFIYFLQKSAFHFPLLPLELLLALAGLIVFLYRLFRSQEAERARRRLVLFLGIFVMGFWLGYITNSAPSPRYTAMIIFPLAALLALMMVHYARASLALAALLSAGGLLNQNGRFLAAIPAHRGTRSGAELERDREFLKDLDGNRALCRAIEQRYTESPIVVKSPFTQMLSVREFGYVTRSLPYLVEAGRQAAMTRAMPFLFYMRRPGPHKTLCIYSPNVDELHWGPSLKPLADETILLEDHSLPDPTIVFIRDWDRHPPVLPDSRR